MSSVNVPNLGVGISQTFTNVLNSDTLSATITALEQSGESQTLSAPRLTVLNNRPASIADGKVQYYYEEYTVKQTVQQYYTSSSFVPQGKPTKITAGAELNVLASISGDGKSILLALNPRVNTDVQLVTYATLTDYNAAGNIQNTFDVKLPQYRTQELATRVTVKSGETVVMGGVIERNRSTLVESVPVLGDLPLIGFLFRRRTEQDIPRYLLVFVTATIVKDTGEYLMYGDQPGISGALGATGPGLPTQAAPPATKVPAQTPPASTNAPSTPSAVIILTNTAPSAVTTPAATPPPAPATPAPAAATPPATNAPAATPPAAATVPPATAPPATPPAAAAPATNTPAPPK
jgi:type IV pilus assembly protein PilQ